MHVWRPRTYKRGTIWKEQLGAQERPPEHLYFTVPERSLCTLVLSPLMEKEFGAVWGITRPFRRNNHKARHTDSQTHGSRDIRTNTLTQKQHTNTPIHCISAYPF